MEFEKNLGPYWLFVHPRVIECLTVKYTQELDVRFLSLSLVLCLTFFASVLESNLSKQGRQVSETLKKYVGSRRREDLKEEGRERREKVRR